MMDTDQESFEQASKSAETGLFADLFAFMVENAKWWLIPIVVVLFLLGILIVAGATGAGPFIYTLF